MSYNSGTNPSKGDCATSLAPRVFFGEFCAISPAGFPNRWGLVSLPAGFPGTKAGCGRAGNRAGRVLTIAQRCRRSTRPAEIQGVTNELVAVCRQEISKRIHLSAGRFIVAMDDWDNLLAPKTKELRRTRAGDGRRRVVVPNVYAFNRILFAAFS